MTEAEELELLELEEEEAATRSTPVPAPSDAQAALAGIQQLGSFGWGDEAGAALQGLLMKATGKGNFGETYRQARDENRTEAKAARELNPVPYYVAGVPAGMASSAFGAIEAAPAAALLTRALAGGATGAAQGALAGAGDSEANTAGGVAGDATKGGLLGGTVGTALPYAGALLKRALARPANAVGNWLKEKAIDQGRRVLTNGADSLSTRNKVRDDAVEEAIRERGIVPFGTTKGTLERLQGTSAKQYSAYNQVVEQLAERGVRGPDAEAIAQKLLAEASDLESNTLNESLPELYRRAASQVVQKTGNPKAPRLGLVQSENLKRSAQDMADYGRIEETPANEVYRDIATIFRKGNEEAIDEQTAKSADAGLRALGSQFVPVKQKMGRLIEATSAAKRGAARGAQRSAIGPKEIAAGMTAAASGNLQAVPAAMAATKAANTRIPSAVASYGLRASDALKRSPNEGDSRAAWALIQALRGPLKESVGPYFYDAGSITEGER